MRRHCSSGLPHLTLGNSLNSWAENLWERGSVLPQGRVSLRIGGAETLFLRLDFLYLRIIPKLLSWESESSKRKIFLPWNVSFEFAIEIGLSLASYPGLPRGGVPLPLHPQRCGSSPRTVYVGGVLCLSKFPYPWEHLYYITKIFSCQLFEATFLKFFSKKLKIFFKLFPEVWERKLIFIFGILSRALILVYSVPLHERVETFLSLMIDVLSVLLGIISPEATTKSWALYDFSLRIVLQRSGAERTQSEWR